jgi:hypothetical protein
VAAPNLTVAGKVRFMAALVILKKITVMLWQRILKQLLTRMSNHSGTTAKLVCTPSCQFVVESFVGEALYSVLTYYLYKMFKMKILSNLIRVASVTKT